MATTFKLTQVSLNTSTGTQDITVSGAGTCIGAFFWMSNATSNASAVDHAHLCTGAVDGTREWAHAMANEDNVGTSAIGYTRGMVDKCLFKLDESDGSVEGESEFDSFITDGVRVDHTTAYSSAYKLNVLLVFGDGTVHTDYYELTADRDITDLDCDFGICVGNNGTAFDDTSRGLATMTFGVFALNPSIAQAGFAWLGGNKFPVFSTLASNIVTGSFLWRNHEVIGGTDQVTDPGTKITAKVSGGFTMQSAGDGMGIFMVQGDPRLYADVQTERSTGSGSSARTGYGVSPDLTVFGLSHLTALDVIKITTVQGVPPCGVGMAIDASNEYSSSPASIDAKSPSNTKSYSDATCGYTNGYAFNGDPRPWRMAYTSADSDGYTVNITDNLPQPYWTALCVGAAPAAGGRVVSLGGHYRTDGRVILT